MTQTQFSRERPVERREFLRVLRFPPTGKVHGIGYMYNKPTVIGICCCGFPFLAAELSKRSIHLVVCFRCVTITSDGSKALSASEDSSFRVWDLDTSAYLKQGRSRGHAEDVIDIAMTSDGSRCVSSSMDGTFKIWKCQTAEECFTLRGNHNGLFLSKIYMK